MKTFVVLVADYTDHEIRYVGGDEQHALTLAGDAVREVVGSGYRWDTATVETWVDGARVGEPVRFECPTGDDTGHQL